MKNKLKKPNLLERLRNWWGYLLYKMIGVRYGPFMYCVRGDWWFIDSYGDVYSIRYTGMRGQPFIISCERLH